MGLRLGGFLRALVLLSVAVSSFAVSGTEEKENDPFAHLAWRNVGPVNMSGRVTDVEGIPGDPRTVYVGTAAGGVWKTTDGGLTFEPIFDDQPIASIGDLALAPSNPEVIFVGTGESNVRNSVSFGNGVYRSTDGGASWKHVGLEETRYVSRVQIDPTDPDRVYVGALGHIFGPNEERGVFRSTDGGASWEKVLYLDERHGVADLELDPQNPNILYAALWHFERKPWTHTSGSEDGGVWKSVDGGDSWKKLEDGLPKMMGRIGVKVAPSDPRVVYVIAESNDGTLFRSTDRGKTFKKVSDDVQIVSRGFYYTDLRVDPRDENRVYAVASRLMLSIDGGKTFERISRSTHVDYHSLWIDPTDPRRIWQGQDGGVAVSYDRGRTWEPIRNLPIGQFYQAFYDLREPFYYVGGGLQDNGTWYGPSRTREPSGLLEDDWRMMSFGDAYWVVPHPRQVDLFLSEYQAGGILRTDMRTRQQVDVSPQPRRNDGGPVSELEYRFNWNAPIIASPHDPDTVYFAGNVVWKTRDFGDTWEQISPDLTTDDPDKQGEAGGPVWYENTTAEYHCTILSLAESPVEPGVLWAGTDDGRLQLTRDGGENWTDVISNVPGLPEHSPVSHVEPSRAAAGTAYAAFDRHMFDDLRPHVYKTDDFGRSWRRISDGLPEEGWVWVVREDPRNTDLVWVGTELGLYATRDGGKTWRRMHLENFPATPVHDVLIHPRENDLILGTHGRALWIFDDATPLQQFDDEIAEQPAHLFPIRPALRFPTRPTRYGLGDKLYQAPNPPAGAILTYYLQEGLDPEKDEADDGEDEDGGNDSDDRDSEGAGGEAGDDEDELTKEDRLKIEILDGDGAVIRTLDDLPAKTGLNRTAWDLATEAPRKRKDDGDEEASDFTPPPSGPRVLPGTYTVRLTLDGETWEQPVEVRLDPLVDVSDKDLRAQYDASARLTEMRSTVNDHLRALDVLLAQIESRRETAKLLHGELPDALEKALEEAEKAAKETMGRWTRNPDKPFWSQGPRLAGHLSGLFNDLEGQFAAPTAAQREYLAELETELAESKAETATFLADGLVGLQETLAAHDLPPVAVPDPETIGADRGDPGG